MGSHPSKLDPISSVLLDKNTVKSRARKDRGHDKKGQWCELPLPALEKIYFFASRDDQLNMSLVCSKWSEGFYSPSVCRTFIFNLTDSQLTKDSWPSMSYVHKCSSMFQHVEIECNFIRKKRLIKTWCRHLTEFLQILASNTQLISVKFRCSLCSFEHLYTPIYNVIFRVIADFLGSQRRLKRAEFCHCFFRLVEAVEILRNLTEHNRYSLTHLVLRDFVRFERMDQEHKSKFLQHLPKLGDLPSLTTFETDYSLIFENMAASQSDDLKTIKKSQPRVLSKLILKYSGDLMELEHCRGLTSTDWKFLKILCPDLQVDLSITTFSSTRQELEFFIVPNMPITRLDYWYDTIDEGADIALLFHHLLACKINDHLVTLHLDWKEPIEHLSSTIIPFLQACTKLKCLELCIIPLTNDIELLLESWLENRHESLEKAIIVLKTDKENYGRWVNSTTEYVSLLELAGLSASVDLHT